MGGLRLSPYDTPRHRIVEVLLPSPTLRGSPVSDPMDTSGNALSFGVALGSRLALLCSARRAMGESSPSPAADVGASTAPVPGGAAEAVPPLGMRAPAGSEHAGSACEEHEPTLEATGLGSDPPLVRPRYLISPMPHTTVVCLKARSARVQLYGTVALPEIVEVCREVFLHPAWQHGFSMLWDAQDLRALSLLPEDVESFAEVAGGLTDLRGPGRTAVVTEDPTVHMSALLLSLKSKRGEERDFEVFGRLEAAEAWLAGVDSDT